MNSALYENNLSSVLWRHTISIVKAVKYCGGFSVLLGEIFSAIGDVKKSEGKSSVLRKVFIATAEYHQYFRGNTHSHDIPHSTDGIPHSTAHPPQYWWFLSTVLMVSSTVLSTLYSYEILPQYWTSSTVMKSLHSTDDVFSKHWWYPSQYQTSPIVLNARHSTAQAFPKVVYKRSDSSMQMFTVKCL